MGRSVLAYAVAGLVMIGLMLGLDAQGVFIYLSYYPLYLVGLAYTAVGVGYLASGRWRGKVVVPTVILSAVVLLAASVATPHIPTSGRKRFFLVASEFRVGMSTSQLRERMAGYRAFEADGNQGFITFSFRTNAATEDHVIVQLTEDGESVRSIEFSAD